MRLRSILRRGRAQFVTFIFYRFTRIFPPHLFPVDFSRLSDVLCVSLGDVPLTLITRTRYTAAWGQIAETRYVARVEEDSKLFPISGWPSHWPATLVYRDGLTGIIVPRGTILQDIRLDLLVITAP